jgi:hypothetical protein
MSGISREVAEHSLDVLPHSKVVQQRLRCFDEKRCQAIGAELRRLRTMCGSRTGGWSLPSVMSD